MTKPSDPGFGLEQPEADVVEQRREEAQPTDPELEPIDELPEDANEADVVDQHHVVPVEEEYRG
ncbi:MAG TPA: hypothetical protein VGX25_15090 [Actinophytocola sp.]|uniref:hypothetical protein n=1 Tax=Actinophytocola sp. TaxID=1872138 RepID=UPI002DDDB0F2|nr:hypothetical protein [Actinophytocola sp.]HEV2780713.1 hypothetical protein [Actinophytocola sp.]